MCNWNCNCRSSAQILFWVHSLCLSISAEMMKYVQKVLINSFEIKANEKQPNGNKLSFEDIHHLKYISIFVLSFFFISDFVFFNYFLFLFFAFAISCEIIYQTCSIYSRFSFVSLAFLLLLVVCWCMRLYVHSFCRAISYQRCLARTIEHTQNVSCTIFLLQKKRKWQ